MGSRHQRRFSGRKRRCSKKNADIESKTIRFLRSRTSSTSRSRKISLLPIEIPSSQRLTNPSPNIRCADSLAWFQWRLPKMPKRKKKRMRKFETSEKGPRRLTQGSHMRWTYHILMLVIKNITLFTKNYHEHTYVLEIRLLQDKLYIFSALI